MLFIIRGILQIPIYVLNLVRKLLFLLLQYLSYFIGYMLYKVIQYTQFIINIGLTIYFIHKIIIMINSNTLEEEKKKLVKQMNKQIKEYKENQEIKILTSNDLEQVYNVESGVAQEISMPICLSSNPFPFLGSLINFIMENYIYSWYSGIQITVFY